MSGGFAVYPNLGAWVVFAGPGKGLSLTEAFRIAKTLARWGHDDAVPVPFDPVEARPSWPGTVTTDGEQG